MYRIVVAPHAARALKKLRPSKIQQQLLIKAIDSLRSDPSRGYALRKELKGLFKLRVGDYRIVYDVHTAQRTVTVVGIGHRKNIYETLARKTRLL